ncbi:F-box/kelch-repeat protein [Camellia lanceoleosa]|uniref:F-box/kelch-repeat protein n=1 Tax=Camellia lanceoleosa TaxID=1840588 RepID=A0ACC0FBG7_9ERIC|nr:F-box/kelch-repeat protein [Camellia lanceoleosa]
MELLPGLPNDVALECLIRIPFDQFSVASSVCRGWKAEIERPEFRRHRKLSGLAQSVIVLARARVEPTRKTHLFKHLARLVYRIMLCDPETGYWSELPPVRVSRWVADVLSLGQCRVRAGADGRCDPVTWESRDECKAVFHRGKFHVISGYPTNAQGRFERDAEAFDLTTQRWDPVQEDFLDDAMCPRTCVDGSDARRLYMCRNGNVMACKNATWQVLSGLPAEVCNAAYVTTWQGKLLVIGSAKIGEPHRAYVMDLKNCKWTKLESPEEYSGHVQTGCCLEI